MNPKPQIGDKIIITQDTSFHGLAINSTHIISEFTIEDEPLPLVYYDSARKGQVYIKLPDFELYNYHPSGKTIKEIIHNHERTPHTTP